MRLFITINSSILCTVFLFSSAFAALDQICDDAQKDIVSNCYRDYFIDLDYSDIPREGDFKFPTIDDTFWNRIAAKNATLCRNEAGEKYVGIQSKLSTCLGNAYDICQNSDALVVIGHLPDNGKEARAFAALRPFTQFVCDHDIGKISCTNTSKFADIVQCVNEKLNESLACNFFNVAHDCAKSVANDCRQLAKAICSSLVMAYQTIKKPDDPPGCDFFCEISDRFGTLESTALRSIAMNIVKLISLILIGNVTFRNLL